MILKDWEWKNKIFFDKCLYEKVREYESLLKEEEKKIFCKQIEFYNSFYTFNNLIIMIENDLNSTSLYLEIATKKIECCSYTDGKLENYFNEKIKNLPIESKYQETLKYILNYSLKSNLKISYLDYLKISFKEKDLENIIDYIKSIYNNTNKLEYHPIYPEKLDIKKFFTEQMELLKNNRNLQQEYGLYNDDSFDIIIKDDEGYGEWWDKDLYQDYKNDTLVLFNNENSSIDDFIYTFIHEVYPGHRHFFKNIKKQELCIDTSSILIIEGYATFVELNTVDSIYANNLRHRYAKIILSILNNETEALSFNSLFNVNQNIGFVESYYFGAFMIEYFIRNKFKSAKEFLAFISKNNLGEFFKLW